MKTLAITYFTYMFVSFYLLLMTILLYLKNRNVLFDSPKITKEYSISFLVPIYNEGLTIKDTIKSIFEINYNNILEVIAINDGSTDNTFEILKELKIKYPRLKILNKTNSGKADSLNKAIKLCKGELIAVVDSDSFPSNDSLSNIVGYFDDPRVGVATIPCIPRNKSTFLEKLQLIEYKVIAFTRKLLEYIDAIYVVPGPLALYRKEALEDIGGFDTKNMTEDIEATWHLIHNGWKVRMSLNSLVATQTPDKVKPWFRQRVRWGIGGLQCIIKYKNAPLRNKTMLGYFIWWFFSLGLVLGLVGIGIFLYVFIRGIISNYLIVHYSVGVGVPIMTMNEIYITPGVLNYFGIILFSLFFIFTFFTLAVMKDNAGGKQSFFNLLFYMLVYLLIYPIVLIISTWELITGKRKWR